MKSIVVLLFLAACIVGLSSAVSCRDEYRCTYNEVCWNGECVQKDPYAQPRRSLQYGYNVPRMDKICSRIEDCRGLGFGYVCSKGSCRLISSS